MFRNYLATAWRSARQDRLYSLLNVIGLALGFAVVILIWLFVRDELSYNSFLPGYQDVYWIKLDDCRNGPAAGDSTRHAGTDGSGAEA